MRDLAAAGLRLALPLWAGLAIGISFLEAPVKFQAPSLTTAVGLDVGRHVFAASHLAQLGLAAAALALAFRARASRRVAIPAGLAAVALVVQHLAVLPVLDERARILIAGGTPAGASPHAAYVALEVAKVLLLLVAAAWAARRGQYRTSAANRPGSAPAVRIIRYATHGRHATSAIAARPPSPGSSWRRTRTPAGPGTSAAALRNG